MKKKVLWGMLTGCALLAFPVWGQLRLEAVQPAVGDNAVRSFSQMAAGEHLMGYCNDNATLGGVQLTVAATLSAAIRFPAEKAELWKGSRLERVKIGLGDASITNMKLIIFKSIDEEPVYTQPIEAPVKGWNEITLTTPYEIGSGELFIGYTGKVAARKGVVGYDTKIFNLYSSWLKMEVPGYGSAGWEDLYNNRFGSLAILGVVSGDQYPRYDLSLDGISSPEYIPAGETFAISGTVTNWGEETVTELTLGSSTGGKEETTVTLSDLNIPYKGTYTFTLPEEQAGTTGYQKNTLRIARINTTQEDECALDNTASSSLSIYTPDQTFPRKVLMENFTTELCVYCPGGHQTLNSVLNGRTDVIWVSHHAGYGTDSYTLEESEMLLPFYNSNEVFAPAVMLDRTLFSNTQTPGPVFGVSSALVKNALKEAFEIPAFVTVNITGEYETDSRLLTVSVTGEATAPLPGDSLLLTIYLTEDGIFTTGQAGSSGPYTHNHLLRAVLTKPFGDPVGLPSAAYTSKTYTFTLPVGWKPENMTVIAFVNNLNPYNVLDCKVMNSDALSFAGLMSTEETAADGRMRILAEPGILRLEGSYERLEIYTAGGLLVKTVEIPVPVVEVPELNRGVYVVRVISGGRPVVRKVVW